jgi:hypothetical protein
MGRSAGWYFALATVYKEERNAEKGSDNWVGWPSERGMAEGGEGWEESSYLKAKGLQENFKRRGW